MVIENVRIFQEDGFSKGAVSFDKCILDVRDVVSQEGAVSDDAVIDGADGYLIPGLIDVHTHAAVGADASDGDTGGIAKMSRYYAADGVTSFCPTTMTFPEDILKAAIRSIRDCDLPKDGAKIAGIHMEGPFISKEKCGAQNPDYICPPDAGMFHRLQEEAQGLIRLITVAPEVEGITDFISEIGKECTVSLGHTNADYDTAMRAFEAGAHHATHLFNAMPPLHHRAPGVIAAASDAGATVELVPDGIHVDPAVMRLTHRLFGEKLVLISDSLRCAGMPDGVYELGGQKITVKDQKATLFGTDTIAGSSIHLMEGVRRAVRFGIPLEDAVMAATVAPARAIGLFDRIGSIEPGKDADLVLLDHDLQVKAVFINGRRL